MVRTQAPQHVVCVVCAGCVGGAHQRQVHSSGHFYKNNVPHFVIPKKNNISPKIRPQSSSPLSTASLTMNNMPPYCLPCLPLVSQWLLARRR